MSLATNISSTMPIVETSDEFLTSETRLLPRAGNAIRIAFPALGNNLVSLVKNSSLVSTIGMVELMFVANDIAFNNFRTFEIYGAAALLYVLLVLALTRALHLAERRMARAR